MPKHHTFVVMVEISTNDPRLTEDKLAAMNETAGKIAAVRHAVIERLTKDLTRLIAIMPTEQAKQLMLLHEAVGAELGVEIARRPPADYVPPTRE